MEDKAPLTLAGTSRYFARDRGIRLPPADPLAPRSLQALFAGQVIERYPAPRPICWEGEPASHVFHLLEGCLRVYRTVEDGRRAILRFAEAGDILCLAASETYLFTAEAVTLARFSRIARRRFDAIIDADHGLRRQMDAEICRETRSAQDHIVRLGRTGADERLAAFLLEMARPRSAASPAAAIEVLVPFGRLDIADYLGLTVETISRELSKLRRRGLISTKGPHRIVLDRIGELRVIAAMTSDGLIPAPVAPSLAVPPDRGCAL